MNDKLIDIAAEIRGETEKAWKLFDGTVEAWVPKSRAQDNGDGTFTLESWIYDRAGFSVTKKRDPAHQTPFTSKTLPWYRVHQRINKITSEMSIRTNKATTEDARRWLADLKLIIAEWERELDL